MIPYHGCTLRYPRRGIVVAHVKYHKLPVIKVHFSLFGEVPTLFKFFVCNPFLFVLFVQRKMLPKRGIRQCTIPNSVGIFKRVVCTYDTTEFPFSRHIIVCPPALWVYLNAHAGNPPI